MKSMMQGSSETSSEETDHHQKDYQDDSTSAKRSYECTFCRRGFTNAQALGGHMNIHGKDKAKAKQLGTPTMAPSCIPQISSQTSIFYSIFESQRNYFQPSTPYLPYEFLNPTRYQSLNANEEVSGPNLSLQIGPSYVTTDQVRRGIQKDGEVLDLELRLRHDPYSNYKSI